MTWETVSFPSTLYLQPVLDVVLASVPEACRYDLRLGLQEALVNAAKHGNRMDLQKSVCVRFTCSGRGFRCVISDQGVGFVPPKDEDGSCEDFLPCDEQACGRGLFILHQVFDCVRWNAAGTELELSKRFESIGRPWLRASSFLSF
jgi:serine/threonine-protein kinase RsbW